MIVQAISRRDFKYRFPIDFHVFVAAQYENKKEHRDAIFENLKKDYELKTTQYKADSMYCFKNSSIPTNLTTKSAKQSFNRQIQREIKVTEEANPYYLKSMVSPRELLTQPDFCGNSLREDFQKYFCKFDLYLKF